MRIILGFLFTIMIAAICVSIYQTKKVKGRLAQKISVFLIMALITLIVNAISYITTSYFWAVVAVNAYCACIDWTLLCMLHYVEEYTRILKINRTVRGILFGAIMVDNLILAGNIFLNLVFKVDPVVVEGEVFYAAAAYQSKSLFHILVAYSLVALNAILLIVKAMKTPRFYRTQYFVILSLFTLVVVACVASLAMGSLIDLSVFFYFIMALAVSPFSLYFIPRKLADRTMNFALNDMSEMVFCFDLQGSCVYFNKRVATDFEYIDIKAAAEQSFAEWFAQNQMENKENLQWIEKKLVGGKVRHLESVYHKLTDGRNECIGYFFVVTDRTEEVENYRKEHYRVTHDELTGLYNKEYFFEQVEQVLKNNPDKTYYLLCTNIYGFKIYNELFGEASGDEVLLTQADLMRKTTGISDVYGRLSEDEFGMLVAEEFFFEDKIIQHTLTLRNEFSNSLYSMHIYVGVYVAKNLEEPVEQMCNKARLAIDSIKGKYDTVFAYFDESLLEKTLSEQKLVGQLEKALDEEQFCIYLQPQVTADGTVVGAEALMRWQHPERGLLSPGSFVAASEHTGLLWKVDRYIWEEAVRRLKIWQSIQKTDWYISVNISLSDFFHIDIYETLVGLVEKYKIEPRNLKLELGESMLMQEHQEQMDMLLKLRNYGFEILIDDFGSGYSSLNMLKDNNVDALKIDMKFLQGGGKKERSWAILQSIIDLAKELEMQVVAEGVETEEQMQRLKAVGCSCYQGYYFAKPMPVDEFEYQYM